VGCSSTPQKEGTGQYIDDSVITAKVKAAIFDNPTTKATEINVETFKGVVQLSGFVSSQDAANKAVELTNSVGGVKSVKNDMRLK
jgi:hyperosmotically inducible protein